MSLQVPSRLPALLLLAAGLSAAELELRYIAHAAFYLTSPAGVRVVIDPYNSHVWLRYTFPDDLSANAVLVSHPHFDHDAHCYIRGSPAVFREPGQYAVGDVRITGIQGKQARTAPSSVRSTPSGWSRRRECVWRTWATTDR